MEHGISPVNQNITNLSTHLERRSSLSLSILGFTQRIFRGKKGIRGWPRFGDVRLHWVDNTPEELEAVVSETVKNPDSMSGARKKAAERYLYRTDGKASARLVDAIEEHVGEGER